MISFIGQKSSEVQAWLTEHCVTDMLQAQVSLPFVPLPDNFTPPTRTPWGGAHILGTYKKGLTIRAEKQYPIVGESWEISADPAAPCQCLFHLKNDTILVDLIQLLDLFPEQILGQGVAAKFDGQNPILVKLLDAADHLSVQVHPSDDYHGLRPDESGKPESWYILEAEPGAGLYFGLREGVTQEALRQAIEQREDVSRLLNFVEVTPEDFFVIDAGTLHAIGAGVTLIEPQKIAPKKSGKTYRLWDWNRTYDAEGTADPNGTARELHVEDSLRLIDFDGPQGNEFLHTIRPDSHIAQQNGDSAEIMLVETENFGVSRITLRGGHELSGDCSRSFHGIVVYEGRMDIYNTQGKRLAEVSRGQSVILPAQLQKYTLKGKQAKGVKVYYPAQYLE